MKSLKKIVNSDAAYEILDRSNCGGSTWTEGGCAILAQALNMLGDYPIYVIYNKTIDSSEHFGVMTPSGTILDGDGEHSSADAWLNFFRENEMPRAVGLVVIPFDSGVDMEGINFDDDAAKELALLIKSHQMIREAVRGVIIESINSDRYILIPYGEDVEFEEFGLDEYEAADRAEEIAKDGGVTILRGQELVAIMLDTNSPEVIGGLWVSSDMEKFSFDIAIDSSYQNMGLSSKLIDAAIGEYETQKSMHEEMGSDFKMEVDVINPKLAQILQKKYGFHIVGHLSQDRVLMSVNESLKEGIILKENQDRGFIDWLSMKLGKKIGNRLGGGMFGEVFEMGPVVIKISNKEMFDSESITSKNIHGIAKIYAHGKINVPSQFAKKGFGGFYVEVPRSSIGLGKEKVLYYLIMEKLYIDNNLENEIDDVRWVLDQFLEKTGDGHGLPSLRVLFEKRDDMEFLVDLSHFIYEDFPKEASNYVETLSELVVIFRNVGEHFDWMDIHAGQFGKNSKGEIVAFDLDNPNVATGDFHKHVVHEETELKNISDDDEYWDRVKIIAKNKKGEEVGYAVLDMGISPETELSFQDGEYAYTDDEIEQHFPEDFAAKLEHLEVYPKFRKSGYAKELMDAVVKYVKSRDYKTLYLIASPIGVEPKISLDALSKFYSGYGFEVIKDFGNAHDMVTQLKENVISTLRDSSAEKVWYHGTPDVRDLEKEGGFTQRYLNIEYVDDIEGYDKVQDELSVARESGDKDRYFKILDTVKNFRKNAKIRKPIFLTDTHSIARTYADPQRAFDYQNSVEKVLKVRLKDGNGVTINAFGDRFRFIDIDKVKRGFINAGVDEKEFDLIVRRLNYAVSVKKGIKTDNVAAIGDWFGFDYIDVVGVLDSYNGGNTKSTVRMVFNPSDIEIIKESNNLREFEEYIDSVFNILKESDEPSPTFEWDVAKEKIDNSKRGVKTREQAYEYLVSLLDKIKNLPKAIKIRVTKYVAMSFMMLLGAGVINGVVSEKTPEISHEIATIIDNISSGSEVEEDIEPIRSSSDSLVKILKYEEGSITNKGEPVLKAYRLGDGMITVGWGHAERTNNSQFRPGQEITRQNAEELLAADIIEAERGLNIILNDWKEQGIDVKITQPMYDAMISMIFNMGIGNFRKSDFIQLVKDGDYEMAAERILTTNVSYPGHVPRRQKESELFSKGLESNDISEVRNIIRAVLKEEVIEETQTGQKDLEGFANDILQFLGKLIVREKEHMEFLTSGLENESSDITHFPAFATGTMTGEKYKEISDFVSETSIKIIPTQGLPKGTRGDMGYAPPGPSGREIFEIRLKYSSKDVEEINKLFKDQGDVKSGDVYFRLYYMFYTVLLHELQHAYDAWRSKGKAFTGAVNKDFIKRREDAKRIAMSKQADELNPEEMDAIQNSFKEYQNLVHEINARYAQAMHSVRMTGVDYKTFDKVMNPWEGVYKSFVVEFDGWRNLSDKMKRKLTRRLAKAYSETADIVAADNK